MTLLHPLALALLATWLLVILFAVLRTRQRRREVSALFLWKELRDSPAARTRNLRFLLDPLLLLQLAAVLAFALALAEPVWTSRHAGVDRLAVVIDGSASMRTAIDGERTRYHAAVDLGVDLIRQASARSVAVVQASSGPAVLAPDGSSPANARASLEASVPTWRANGTVADLTRAVSAIGGPGRFQRIVFVTDQAPVDMPFPMETVLVSGGENVAITAFTVRPSPEGAGAVAFVEIHNATADFQSAELRIGDEFRRTTLDAFLEPGETVPYVVPFPGSRGTQFTATLDIDDDYAGDNVRYFSFERSVVLRVHWIGAANRFLSAALESAIPVTRVGDGEAADLTVVCDAVLPGLPAGHLLLVHSSVDGVVALDPSESSRGTAAAWASGHPLLDGVRPEDIFVDRLPGATISVPSRAILGVGDRPLLVEIPDPDRSILVLVADLLATNLPITVDFPLLIRTFVSSLVRSEARLAAEWVHVGDPVLLDRSGGGAIILDPDGAPLPAAADQRAFFPDRPGTYTLVVGTDRFPVSVNVSASESLPAPDRPATPVGAPTAAAPTEAHAAKALWPVLAGSVAALLTLELFLARRRAEASRRRS
ncbi:MAG: VWA domain-containing protein [Candidatus Bipolaricaulia bacterium]